MSPEKAIWYPFWHELDQSIEVGQVGSFDFFKEAPDYVAAEGLAVFYFGGVNDKNLYYSARKRILSIRHHQLGFLDKIDADGLDYTITLSDGTVLKVEAEETPGLVYDFPDRIEDWRVLVETESA